MSFTDDCQRCKRRIADLIVLLENGDDPNKSHSEYICYECYNSPEIQSSAIESWTFAEWDDGIDW